MRQKKQNQSRQPERGRHLPNESLNYENRERGVGHHNDMQRWKLIAEKAADDVEALRRKLRQSEEEYKREVMTLHGEMARLAAERLSQQSQILENPAIVKQDKSQYLTPEEVAAYLRISKAHVNRLARERKLPCVELSRKVRLFTPEQLEEFKKSRTIPLPKVVDKKQPKRLPSVSISSRGGEISSGASLRAQLGKEMRSWH